MQASNALSSEQIVAKVVAASGNRIVGRTRLQKVMYLLDQLGLDSGFKYTYHHYGPYSSDLSEAVSDAIACNLVSETEDYRLSDGVPYSIFETRSDDFKEMGDEDLVRSLKKLNSKSATILELAATIHWLKFFENVSDDGAELRRRKGPKVDGGRERQARELLRDIGLLN